MTEYIKDKNTVFVGNLNIENDSFDHEFGTTKLEGFDVEDFGIIVYINNIDHDVTESIKKNNPGLYSMYKEEFINYCMKGL